MLQMEIHRLGFDAQHSSEAFPACDLETPITEVFVD